MKKKQNENEYYLLDNSFQNIYRLGFRYSPYDECHVLFFPLMKYKNKPTILCKLRLKRLDNRVEYYIIKTSKELLGIYYNRKYGNAANYISRIDKKLHKMLYQMGFRKVTSKKYKQQKGEKRNG